MKPKHNKCRQHRTFGAGQSFRGSICAWLRHYRTNRSTPSLPLLQALHASMNEKELIQEILVTLKVKLECYDWNTIESLNGHGEWEMAFDMIVNKLAESSFFIEPKLRKLIDCYLEVSGMKRNEVEYLDKLNYGDYWKKQYGYE